MVEWIDLQFYAFALPKLEEAGLQNESELKDQISLKGTLIQSTQTSLRSLSQ